MSKVTKIYKVQIITLQHTISNQSKS